MFTITIALIIIAIYIFLEALRYKNKSNSRLTGTLMLVQAILWALMAVDNWAGDTLIKRIIYVGFILLSIVYGIREFMK